MADAPAALEYMRAVMERLEVLAHQQEAAIAAAAELCHAAVTADGMIYLLGVGHCHLLAEEGHFRAGGLAAVCPILSSPLMLHESAASGGRYERLTGIGPLLVEPLRRRRQRRAGGVLERRRRHGPGRGRGPREGC